MRACILSVFILLPLLFSGTALGKAKPTKSAEATTGWYAEPATKKSPGWRGSCYFPPDFNTLGDGARREARQTVLEAMKSQWLGQRDDIVRFDPNVVERAEMAIWGRPEQTEGLARRNLEFCRAVMAGGSDPSAWAAWLSEVPNQLRVGQCVKPLDYAFVQYLQLDGAWQDPVPMCEGDHISIRVTTSDRYRLKKGGAWIDANGDPSDPAGASKLPCNREGCFRGQVIGRFVTAEGAESVFPIGSSATFRAPSHGTFSFAVNDDSAEDNTWHSSGSVIDHAAVSISPLE